MASSFAGGSTSDTLSSIISSAFSIRISRLFSFREPLRCLFSVCASPSFSLKQLKIS